MERKVRIWKGYEPERGTYHLESSDRETSQDTERMQASTGHSHPGEPRWRDKSGHGTNAIQQGALTNWRAQMERQVRTWKECKPAMGTHKLESPDRKTSQDMDRI